jgi:hypothetical protein
MCVPWISSAILTEVFRAFSSVVRQMPGYNSQRLGTANTLQIYYLCYFFVIRVVLLLIVMFYAVFVCKCVLPPGVCPIAVDKYININYQIFKIIFHTKAGDFDTFTCCHRGTTVTSIHFTKKALYMYIRMHKAREKHDHYLNHFLVPLWFLPPSSKHIMHRLWASGGARGKFTCHSKALLQMAKTFMNSIFW